ncbi:MAG: hypothetical protein ACRDLO_11660 [Solirubrobacterales bacterium]
MPLTGRRWAIIAAEAAGLGLVILVIYLTLLRPDGDNPLFDVDVPGDGQRTAQGPNRDGPDRGRDGRDARAGGPANRGEREGPGRIEDGERASRRGGRPPFGSPQAPPSGAGDSPTADQYLDTLARLNARLNAADG